MDFCALPITIISPPRRCLCFPITNSFVWVEKQEIRYWEQFVPKKEKSTSHIKVDYLNGLDPKVVHDRVSFEHLTPLFPQKFKLADKPTQSLQELSICSHPLEKDSGMIVSQPLQTMLLKDIANAIAAIFEVCQLSS